MEKIEWHPHGTPGPFVVEADLFGSDYATTIAIPGRAGMPGVTVARCEHNWNEAEKGERRISWKEAETNARMFREGPAMVQGYRELVEFVDYATENGLPVPKRVIELAHEANGTLARIDGQA